MDTYPGSITDVPGILVGHAQNAEALTGCSVVICEQGATGGVDQRGGAPGTRETDALRPMHLVEKIHAVVLSGGSAFGLSAASGAMRWLAEKGIGFPTGVVPVPIVASAILFDLGIGDPTIYPDEAMGYHACQQAVSAPPAQGNAGAGTGATAGKILGMSQAMKSGIGTASMYLSGGIVIGALVAVNPLGDVIDPESGKILCGARTLKKGPVQIGKSSVFADTLAVMNSLAGRSILHFATRQNTVIGVVATNAKLSKEQANYVAMMAQDGLAMSIRPAHTLLDGDTLFVMATGEKRADPNIIGAYSAQVVARAIVNAVLYAQPVGGIPCAGDYLSKS